MSTEREDRIKGVLLGQAAGDALGAGYETGLRSGGTAEMIGGGFGFEPGEYTDDTDQAVCVALARSDPGKVAEYLLGWYASGPKDVGGTTARLLSSVDRLADAGRMAEVARMYARQDAQYKRPEGWDPGMANGSLMRTGPACLPFLGDRGKVARVARELSDLTHYDVWAGDTCAIWSLLIHDAIELGSDFDLRAIWDIVNSLNLPDDRGRYWELLIAQALSGPEPHRRNGSAVGAFHAALWAVAHAESLADGLQRAVAIGGDTDTVAAIAGALLGAIHGASAVPQDWRRVIHGWSPSGRIWALELEWLALYAADMNSAPPAAAEEMARRAEGTS